MTRRLDPAQERSALALLEAALDNGAGDPASFIRNHGEAERAVRERALRLFGASGEGSASLQTGGAARLGDEADTDDPIPERIGDYRIEELLGRGGMGAVYAASRADADFDHRVAIKVVRPGILNDRLIDRFRRERQILAGLRHPHIAQLYDGGETADGAPFIVMELVDGISLSRWLNDQHPPLAARLSIMEQICAAVEFAHQNLIVHRDLTPGNVLVTPDNGAKLIDFGIARLHETDSPAQPHSGLTALSLTPGFAAPERRAGGAVTTLSDIYSLGKILANLIKPFDDPELQAIAEKAAAEMPENRYPAAATLAGDIRRYRAGHAIAAYRNDGRYRLGKYVARNRLPVALASLAALVMVVGLVMVTTAWREAAIARDDAEQRFDDVRELSNFLLFDLYDELEDVPGTTKALNDIADRARLYLDALSRSEGADSGVRLEAALAYKRLSDVLGTPIGANLGRREEAGETLILAIAQLRSLHEEAPQDEAITQGLAEALYSQAVFAYIALDDNELAHNSGGESATLYWQLAKTVDAQKYAPLAIDAEIEAAIPLAWIGRGDEAVASLEKTLAKLEKHVQQYGRSTENLGLMARTLSNLSETAGRVADTKDAGYREALGYGDRAIAAYRQYAAASDKPDGPRRSMAISLFKRALLLYSMEDDSRALRDLDEAETIISGLIRRDPEDKGLASTLNSIQEQKAITLAYAGRSTEGLALARQSSAAKRAELALEPEDIGRLREYASNLLIVAEVAEIAERPVEACAVYRESRSIYARIEKAGNLSEYDRDYVKAGLADAIVRTC